MDGVNRLAPNDISRIWAILGDVPDPEIPVVSVVDLGIVRDVRADPASVTITPTYTGCPATQAIERSIRDALAQGGYPYVRVEVCIAPAWTTDWISDQGRDRLKAYGIAPPPKGSAARSLRADSVECPRCGSTRTVEISRFGSTPCKALWQCQACDEPFDRFKCH